MGLRQDTSRHLERSPTLLLGTRARHHYAFRPRRTRRVSPVFGQCHRDGTILCTLHSGRMRDRICSPAMGCKPRLLKRRKGYLLCWQIRCGSAWPCACTWGYGNPRRIRPVLDAPGGRTSLRSGFRVLGRAARHSGHPSPRGLTRPSGCVTGWNDLEPDTNCRAASIGPRTACSAGSHVSRSWTGSSEVALSRACGSCRLRRPRALLDNQPVGRPGAVCKCGGPSSPVRESRWDSFPCCIPIGCSVTRSAIAWRRLPLPHPLRGQICLSGLVSENWPTRRIACICRSPGGDGVLRSSAGEQSRSALSAARISFVRSPGLSTRGYLRCHRVPLFTRWYRYAAYGIAIRGEGPACTGLYQSPSRFPRICFLYRPCAALERPRCQVPGPGQWRRYCGSMYGHAPGRQPGLHAPGDRHRRVRGPGFWTHRCRGYIREHLCSSGPLDQAVAPYHERDLCHLLGQIKAGISGRAVLHATLSPGFATGFADFTGIRVHAGAGSTAHIGATLDSDVRRVWQYARWPVVRAGLEPCCKLGPEIRRTVAPLVRIYWDILIRPDPALGGWASLSFRLRPVPAHGKQCFHSDPHLLSSRISWPPPHRGTPAPPGRPPRSSARTPAP